MKRILLFLSVLQLLVLTSFAQGTHVFSDEVQLLKNYDKQFQQPPRPILFTGSSSIRKWDGLQVAFGPLNVMNRGIGGAVVNDIIYYLNDIVFPYAPRQIVLYVGENDLPDVHTTADSILVRTTKLITLIRAKLPNIPIVYISMKPSPSRKNVIEKAREGNLLVKNYLESLQGCQYVDIFSLMLDSHGDSRPELFVSDMLHMNPLGYAIWEKAVRPYLLLK